VASEGGVTDRPAAVAAWGRRRGAPCNAPPCNAPSTSVRARAPRHPYAGLTLRARENPTQLAQKWAQLQPVYGGIPTGMHGPTCIFRANLTPFPLGAFMPADLGDGVG
jgi:hypothetical protein